MMLTYYNKRLSRVQKQIYFDYAEEPVIVNGV